MFPHGTGISVRGMRNGMTAEVGGTESKGIREECGTNDQRGRGRVARSSGKARGARWRRAQLVDTGRRGARERTSVRVLNVPSPAQRPGALGTDAAAWQQDERVKASCAELWV